MRHLIRLLLKLCFGFRAYNTEVLKTPGPVLLIPNHVSWLDWLYLYAVLDLDWKCVVSRFAAAYSRVHRWIMINRRTFPIDTFSPYSVKRMAEHLSQGGRLVLFAEGQITHTGSLMKIYDGTGFLLHRTSAKVITCYIRGADRLRWSRQPGWRCWWPNITLHFSPVLQPPRFHDLGSAAARSRLTRWLRDRMVDQQFQTEMACGATRILPALVDSVARLPHKVLLQDATMQELTGRRILTGARLLARSLESTLDRDANRVGILLPNVNAMPLLLLGLWSLGRVPAILNFSTGTVTLLACARLAGLRHVITSRTFLARARIDPQPLLDAGLQVLYLEDIRARIRAPARIAALARVALAPRSALPLHPGPTDDPAVVLFTSGSEGAPKGVELTHRNLLANIRQMLAVIDLEDRDRFFNALPTFHSFGLTVGTLLGLYRGLYVFLYPSPLHYRVIPNILYDRNCTVFLATNTFLNGYARRAHPYDFRAVRYLFAGAEKVQEDTQRTYLQRFGIRILEGYGATECSPVIAVNVPMAPCPGSAGRLLPGMNQTLEPVEGVANGGRLLVRGPNVMRGYLNPEANKAFQALGGWYDTGDVVEVDSDGFIAIRGRLKRFAKISGEMVSLAAIEDALAGAFPHYGLRCQVAVLARPDEDKGEALFAVTNEPRLRLDEIRAAIKARGLSNLCVPREVRAVREIPKLGTGKINHRELARLVSS